MLEQESQLRKTQPWELTPKEQASLWESLDSKGILDLARTLPPQFEDLEVQGVFGLRRHLMDTGDPHSDLVEQLINETREGISIPSSRIKSELPFPLTSPAEPNSSLPETLDIDFLEEKLPEKIIQCLVAATLKAQQNYGRIQAHASGQIEERHIKLLCHYLTITAINHLKREGFSTRTIAKFVSAPQSKRDLSRGQVRVLGLLENGRGGFGVYTQPSNPNNQLKTLMATSLIPRDLAVSEGASPGRAPNKWLNKVRLTTCLDHYTRPRWGRPGKPGKRPLLDEIGGILKSPENLLPVIFLMAVGKWALTVKTLIGYKKGDIIVDPEQREDNIKGYQGDIAQCRLLAKEMVKEVFDLDAPEALVFFNDTIEDLNPILYQPRFEDLRGLLTAAQEFLTEKVWAQLEEASPPLAPGFRQEAKSQSGQREQP